MQTNAASEHFATTLEELGTLDQGTLVSLQTRKKGVARGAKGSRMVYGDDLVHVLLWTGFEYKALVERSRRKLLALNDGTLIRKLTKVAHDHGFGGANTTDSSLAIQEVQAWLDQACAPSQAFLTDDPGVWKPLVVNGTMVKGCRVYNGPAKPQDGRAPVPGRIYIQGMKLGEKILEAAPNGPWETQSSMKTSAKKLLRSQLPVGLYAQYVLEPNVVGDLKVGRAASAAAQLAGVLVDPEAVRSLFKIA